VRAFQTQTGLVCLFVTYNESAVLKVSCVGGLTQGTDVNKANDDVKEILSRLVPTYKTIAATSKIHLIQSIISRLLVDTIFEEYFIGLPRAQADELRNMEKYLKSFGKSKRSHRGMFADWIIGSSESMNQWRSTTLAIIRKEAPEKLNIETTAALELVVKTVNDILLSICDIEPSEPRDQSLRALVNNAIELSRLLRVQKAIFSVVMPSIESYQRTIFDTKTMEDIGGEDEDTLYEREIRCVTFPGIIKAGDENGEKEHLRNVVSRMRVFCAPD